MPNLIQAPSTGRTHRWNREARRTRCGLTVPEGRGIHAGIWRVVAALEGDQPTCLHCLYPTRADLDAARR